MAETYRDLGWASTATQRYDDAQRHLVTAVELMREIDGYDAWRVARAESTLGKCLAALGRLDEAEPLLI